MAGSWATVARAHLLRFPRKRVEASAGANEGGLLLRFLALALLLHPLLQWVAAHPGQYFPARTARWLVLGFLLLATWLSCRSLLFGNRRLPGLRRWSEWSREERLLGMHAGLAMALIGALLLLHRVADFTADDWLYLPAAVCTGLAWGIWQELVYRGLLQTALSRRFGAIAGLLLANALYTFGPLHAEYLGIDGARTSNWALLAGVFCIGGYFGLLYHRSGNLLLPMLMHGLWPLNMR